MLSNIDVRPFQAGDETAFRSLNETWIAKYFGLEEKDRLTLEDPMGQILRPGGYVCMAVAAGERIGCCALLLKEPTVFEVAKMAVGERYQGQGVGRKLLEHTRDHALAVGARRLYLETNHTLVKAIHLYESVGFRHIPAERVLPSPYVRADVFMEMAL